MPELPEVETVKRGLRRLIVGCVVTGATNDNPKSFPNSEQDVNSFLIGAKILDVRRRAKVLIINLSTKYSLVIHLKMTGQLVYVSQGKTDYSETSSSGAALRVVLPSRGARLALTGTSPSDKVSEQSAGDDEIRFGAGHPNDSLISNLPDKSTRVTIKFADGSHLYFNDQRKFGWVKLMPTDEIVNLPFMQKVGPEPLEDDFTASQFIARFKRRSGTSIKAALLDQSVIAGVGNIYADESLWGAKLHPKRLVRDLSDVELSKLYVEVRAVMNLSIDKGGSTNRNYVDAEGKKGSYMDFARVFRREGEACYRCGETIIKFKAAGRGTHICPSCQVL